MKNFNSRRISLVEFYSNDQTSKSILEKSRSDMKKQKAVDEDGWEDEEVHNDSEEIRTKALKMGANILSYALMGPNDSK